VGVLRIRQELSERIRAHGAETYPNECCGALLGRDGDGAAAREVTEIVPMTNQRNDSPRNRFSITPEDVRDADAAARRAGLDLIGWYHSHPDAPARPSEFDREHAWPWYSYIIVSVQERVPREMNSWRLADDRGHYDAEEIVIDARASGARSTI
jgi:proteasome lid subunit RPN8/RPN11